MTPKQQQTLAAAAAVVVALVLGAYLLVVKPQMDKRAENDAAAATARTTATDLRSQLATLEAKRAAMPEAEAQMTRLTKEFPNDYRQDEWILMVARTAADAGVRVGSITPSEPGAPGAAPAALGGGAPPPTPTTGTATVAPATPASPASPATPGTATSTGDFLVAQSTVTLDATGTDAQIARFIAALEKMRRPLLIESVSYGRGDDGQASVSIAGKTFLSRPLDAPVQSTDPAPAATP